MKDYYIVVDCDVKDVSVCMYLFDSNHPNGVERKVFTRSFSEDSAFSFEDAKGFCDNLCDIFNSDSFKRESVSFIKSENN